MSPLKDQPVIQSAAFLREALHRNALGAGSKSRLKIEVWPVVIFLFVLSLGQRRSIPPALAQENSVPAAYKINYEVEPSGRTRVSLVGELHNPNQNFYISEYSLRLDYNDLSDVAAADDQGAIVPVIETHLHGRTISLKFNHKVVGLKKPIRFSLNFSSSLIAQKNGLVWEINLPKPADVSKLSSYDVSLSIPAAFGPEIAIRPEPARLEKKILKNVYNFNKESIANSGALLSFGHYQIYGFGLKYHLKNPNFFTGLTTIALPPSIFGDQQVLIDEITPAPEQVETDLDGNQIATYKIFPGQEITVQVKGRAKIFNSKRDVSLSGNFSELPTALQNRYLGPQKYWETQNEAIATLVAKIAGKITPDSKVAVVAKNLFEETAKILTYDPERIEPNLTRYGAERALSQKEHAVCMEFADLYVTLLRAAGIPAELLEGYAATNDSGSRPVIGDVLHSWVRLYLPKVGWIMADPTWANTTNGLDYFSKLDTNHFVFAIKGSRSELPYPAGAYKISPDQVGDIDVQVLEAPADFAETEENLKVEAALTSEFLPFRPSKKMLALTFTNYGKTTLFSPKISFSGDWRNETSATQSLKSDLPPLGRVRQTLEVKKNFKAGENLGQLTWISFEGQVKEKPIFYKRGPTINEKNETLPTTISPKLLGIFLILVLCSFGAFLLVARVGPRP